MKINNELIIATILTTTCLSYAFFSQTLMLVSLLGNFCLIIYMKELWLLRSFRSAAGVSLTITLATMILLLPVAFYKSIYSIYFFFSAVSAIILAYAISSQPHSASSILRWSLVSIQILILTYIAVNIGDNPFPLESILGEAGSSNVVTSFLVLIQSAYIAAFFAAKQKSAWFTTLCTFLICMIGYGRGSIIAAAMLLIIVFALLMFTQSKQNNRLKFFVQIGAVSITALIVYYYFGEIFDFVEANTKLGAGLVDDSRMRMIWDYISRIDGFTLVFGAGYDGTSIMNEFGGNPHNSFIRAHHLFGLAYLVVLMCVSFFSIVAAGSFGRSLLVASLLCVVAFRGFSEPIIFPTPLDFYYFLIVFLFMRKSKMEGSSSVKKIKILMIRNAVAN